MTGGYGFPVVRSVMLRLIGADAAAEPCPALFGYTPAVDPWAVVATFNPGANQRVWRFSRELLAMGLDDAAGIGDVRVWPWNSPRGRFVALTITSPDGSALFEGRRSDVAGFLRSTYASVPRGREGDHVDWDAVVAALHEKEANR